MNPRWIDATARRAAFYADVGGRRVFVEQTVRAHRSHGLVGEEYQASVGGMVIGEFPSLAEAQAAAIDATQTKTPPRHEPRGREVIGTHFDY